MTEGIIQKVINSWFDRVRHEPFISTGDVFLLQEELIEEIKKLKILDSYDVKYLIGDTE